MNNKVPVEFVNYYNALTIPRPAINDFIKLDFRFKIGIYIDFFISKNIFIAVNELGFRVRRNKEGTIIHDEFFNGERIELIQVYRMAVEWTFNYIHKPF